MDAQTLNAPSQEQWRLVPVTLNEFEIAEGAVAPAITLSREAVIQVWEALLSAVSTREK